MRQRLEAGGCQKGRSGILGGSINRFFIIAFLALHQVLAGQNVSEGCAGVNSIPIDKHFFDKASIDCINEALGKGVLVRVDERQKRYFVVQKSVATSTIKAMIKKIEHCLPKDWVDRWSLSVFSMKELAGYQDEPNIKPFHKNSGWAKGYLAEYDSEKKKVTLNPVIRPRTVSIK
jgi:hypothetical protein